MDGATGELMELTEIQVCNYFRAQQMEPDKHTVSEVAAMMVATGGASIIEVVLPQMFAARAGDLGLRPGFAVGLCERKQVAP